MSGSGSNREAVPIFLFSTARSGSTLLQRILGCYPEIATVPEPWLLLPLFYAFRSRGIYAEYEQGTMVAAIEDFCEGLPGGRQTMVSEIREFARRVYSLHLEPQHTYFLDKTPPYFLVVDEIIEAFPEAKLIFLWRNPLAVAASLAQWPARNWGGLYRENLFYGLANLIEAYDRNRERAHAVHFEDLISGDPGVWQGLMAHLGLEFRAESLSGFSTVQLDGRMGDKHGSALYSKLSSEPLEKWRTVLANPLRKEAARRYLGWIGSERLSVMGYDGRALLGELERTPTSGDHLLRDGGNLAKALVREPLHYHARARVNVTRASSLRHILGAPRSL